MSKKVYELKDKSVGFFDRETGTKVVGNGTLEIDGKQRVGKLTHATIKAGGLIEVNRESKSAKGSNDKDSDSSDLPSDLPGREALIAGGFDSVSKVKDASDEDLVGLKGIGNKTLEHVREALK